MTIKQCSYLIYPFIHLPITFQSTYIYICVNIYVYTYTSYVYIYIYMCVYHMYIHIYICITSYARIKLKININKKRTQISDVHPEVSRHIEAPEDSTVSTEHTWRSGTVSLGDAHLAKLMRLGPMAWWAKLLAIRFFLVVWLKNA